MTIKEHTRTCGTRKCAQKKEICNSLKTGRHSSSPKWVHSAQLSSLKNLQELKRLCHWGPIIALGAIAICSTMAMIDSVLWYWPLHTTGGSVNFIMLINWTVMILYNYFNAMFVGPGFVPLGWKTARKRFLKMVNLMIIIFSFFLTLPTNNIKHSLLFTLVETKHIILITGHLELKEFFHTCF